MLILSYAVSFEILIAIGYIVNGTRAFLSSFLTFLVIRFSITANILGIFVVLLTFFNKEWIYPAVVVADFTCRPLDTLLVVAFLLQ